MFDNILDPNKDRRSSKDFVAPTKEQATTGRFMSAGDKYGVGHRNPIGSFKQSDKGAVPMTKKMADPNSVV